MKNDLNEFMVNKPLDAEEIIALMSVYESEWAHREERFWKHTFAFYYAILIVMLFPNLASKLGVNGFPNIATWIFPVVGIAMTFVFIGICYGMFARMQMSYEAYTRLSRLLNGSPYVRRSFFEKYGNSIKGKFLSRSLAFIIVGIMAFSLFLIAGILLK